MSSESVAARHVIVSSDKLVNRFLGSSLLFGKNGKTCSLDLKSWRISSWSPEMSLFVVADRPRGRWPVVGVAVVVRTSSSWEICNSWSNWVCNWQELDNKLIVFSSVWLVLSVLIRRLIFVVQLFNSHPFQWQMTKREKIVLDPKLAHTNRVLLCLPFYYEHQVWRWPEAMDLPSCFLAILNTERERDNLGGSEGPFLTLGAVSFSSFRAKTNRIQWYCPDLTSLLLL